MGKGDIHLKTLKRLKKQNNQYRNRLLEGNNQCFTVPSLWLTLCDEQADIEGAEWGRGGFSDWFNTGALTNVNQLAMEFHVRPDSQFSSLLVILQQLYRLDFRLISQEVNMVVGPDSQGYYNLVEVFFMKTSGWYNYSVNETS